MQKLSTSEAARKLGIHRPNLQRAIARGRIAPPPLTRIGGVRVRLWSLADIERARKALEKTRKRRRTVPRSWSGNARQARDS